MYIYRNKMKGCYFVTIWTPLQKEEELRNKSFLQFSSTFHCKSRGPKYTPNGKWHLNVKNLMVYYMSQKRIHLLTLLCLVIKLFSLNNSYFQHSTLVEFILFAFVCFSTLEGILMQWQNQTCFASYLLQRTMQPIAIV